MWTALWAVEARRAITPVGEAEQLWSACTDALRHKVGDHIWTSQFRPTAALHLTNRNLVVAVPSSVVKERIERSWLPQLNDTLTDLGQPDVTVDFVVRLEPAVDAVADTDDGTRPISPPVPVDRDPRELDGDRAARPSASRSDPAERSNPVNPWYTFDAFVIGASNQFAHNAALAVAESRTGADNPYNPLFIYGPTGLGKTHLLHAIANYTRKHFPNQKVCYASMDTFISDFVNAILAKRINAFKAHYRENHLLLLDDIQFLEGKDETQNEFFHCFNKVHERKGKIVISSDRLPAALSLEERLTSRLQWGLATDIQPPELETRLAILYKKAGAVPISVPIEVLELIASNVTNNIRKLEGALTRVVAYASLNGVPLTTSMATDVLGELLDDTERPTITCGLIIKVTAEMFDLSVDELTGPSRRRPLVGARQIAMYVSREMTNDSYPSIGRAFGGRDHTTVMHAVTKIATRMTEREQTYRHVTRLMRRINEET